MTLWHMQPISLFLFGIMQLSKQLKPIFFNFIKNSLIYNSYCGVNVKILADYNLINTIINCDVLCQIICYSLSSATEGIYQVNTNFIQ